MAQKADIQAQINEIVTGANYRANQMRPMLTDMLDYASAGQTQVFPGLIANGTTSATTLILGVGVNIVVTATNTNYACKLPQPVTGQRVTVVNKSNRTISLFPSNVDGQINNYPIDAPAFVPADGKSYDFICIENPLPGAWTWNAPAINQIEIGEMTVSHTNGVATNAWGIGGSTSSSSTVSVDGNGNLVLTGGWKSENNPTTLARLKCYTNILQSDLAGPLQQDAITATIITAFKTASNAGTFGQRVTVFFTGGVNYSGSFSPVGTLNSPPEVGDTDTLYYIEDAINNPPYNQIGIGGQFSRYYYTFGMYIEASAATKDYKFKFFIEYF